MRGQANGFMSFLPGRVRTERQRLSMSVPYDRTFGERSV